MKRFLFSILLLILILAGISFSFYFNFSTELLSNNLFNLVEPINIFVSIIYIVAWIGLMYLGVKKDFLVINVFRFLLWALSLVSSSITLMINLQKPLPSILSVFSIPNLIINQTILKGIGFSDALIGNNIIFIIIAIFFLFTPIIYRLIKKIISIKIDKPNDIVGQA